MPTYEVIYETGNHSLADYTNDVEALSTLKAHHDRATKGEEGGPSEHKAERIVKVLVYDSHPVDFVPPVYVASSVEGLPVNEALASLAELASPLVNSAPHESNFKMPEVRELELTWQ